MKINSLQLFSILFSHYGALNWWPMDYEYHKKHGSDPRFEVIIGAILTQNTTWSNVEKAIDALKQNGKLNINSIAECDIDLLKQLIRSSGFFNQKAVRLQTIAQYLKNNYQSDLTVFFNQELLDLRDELLTMNGIGPETADSILLYAGSKPIFVVDAYTKRLFSRLQIPIESSYDQIQKFVQNEFYHQYENEKLPSLYNEFHALIVIHAKQFCKKKPQCNGCSLMNYCSFYSSLLG